MTAKTVLTPNTASFDAEVLRREGPVLVDFWAPWCGPCKAMKPVVEAVGAEREGVEVALVNVDENPELASRFGVTSIPALKLFRGGEVVAESLGAQPRKAPEGWLEANGA